MGELNDHAQKIAAALRHAVNLLTASNVKPRSPLTPQERARIPLRLARTVFVNMNRKQMEETARAGRSVHSGMPKRRQGRIAELLLKVVSEKSWAAWRAAALAKEQTQAPWWSAEPIQPAAPATSAASAPAVETPPEPKRTQAELDLQLQHWLIQRRSQSPFYHADGWLGHDSTEE